MSEYDIASPEQEWSHNFVSDDVDTKPVNIAISADKDNFLSLCNRLGLHSIESLSADITLSRNEVSKAIHVEGKIHADVHQKCVVTAEPVAEHINEEFEAWFAEPSDAVSFTKAKRERAAAQDRNEHPMLEEQDDPEEIIGGKIDLGELVTQHLSLSLNPYPKVDGAEYENIQSTLKDDDDIYTNPFAALKDWKADEKKKDK